MSMLQIAISQQLKYCRHAVKTVDSFEVRDRCSLLTVRKATINQAVLALLSV